MTTLVFGHKSPDTDSTGSPIVWAWYLNEVKGEAAKPVLLGEPNTEAAFMLKRWNLDKPEIIGGVEAGTPVVIVDTNNPGELPANVNDANIAEIIDHHLLAALDEVPEQRGVHRGAEVVDVGDPHVLSAARDEAVEQLGAAERVDEIAVTRRVCAGLPLGVAKEVPLEVEAQRELLNERGDVRGGLARGESFFDRGVGRVARHEPQRDGLAGALARGLVLAETQVEERLAVEHLGERLHHAAHARRHPARHGAEGELPARERGLPDLREARARFGAGRRELRELVR